MSEAVLYLPGLSNFSREEKKELRKAIATDKEKIAEAMKLKVNDFKLDLLREALEQKGLNYDKSIDTFFDLRKSIMNSRTYSAEDKKELLDACTYIDSNVNSLLQELLNGSISSIERFLKEMYQKIGKPIAKGAIDGLAISSLIQIAPTIEAKLAVVAASLGISSYKLIRGLKDKAYAKSIAACNDALRELETTKEDGKIVDTRFPENVIREIKEYFEMKSIPFEDTGYLSLRETIYNLDYEHKVELVRIIQSEMGKDTGIDEKLKKYNESFTTFVSNNVIKPISAGASAALPLATVINQIDPALLSGPFNAFVTKLFTAGHMSGFLSWTSAASAGIGTFLLEHVPAVGKYFTAAFAGENIVLLSLMGGALGLALNVSKGIIKAVSNKIESIKNAREEREFRKVELEKYKDSIKEELDKIEGIINENGKDPSKELIINIVCDYLEKKDLVLEERPKTIEQLEVVINGLDKDDKKELVSILKEVLEYSEKYPKSFKEKLSDVARTTMTLLSCGLASLNIIDMLTGKGILKKISNSKLLSGIPGTRLNEIPTIEGSEALQQKIDSEVSVSEGQTPALTNTGEAVDAIETPHACEPPVPDTSAFVQRPDEPVVTPHPTGAPSSPAIPTTPPTSNVVNTPPPIEVSTVVPIDSYSGHHPGTLTTYLAGENPDPAEFFRMFHKDFSGGDFISFAELGREDAERFMRYFQDMEVTIDNKKDFDILSSALLRRVEQINNEIIANNTKIMNLNKVFNGAVAGSVMAETFNGMTRPKEERVINAQYEETSKVR